MMLDGSIPGLALGQRLNGTLCVVVKMHAHNCKDSKYKKFRGGKHILILLPPFNGVKQLQKKKA